MPVRSPDSNVANEFVHGRIIVGTTPVRITAQQTKLVNGVMLKAGGDNEGTIYVGNSDQVTQDAGPEEGEIVSFTDGLPFNANDSYTIQTDELSDIWLVADEADQVMYFLAD
jgi:hypothetical protein